MTRLYVFFARLGRDESGQDMVEYALLAALVAVSAGAVLPGFADNLNVIFSQMGSVTSKAAF